MSHFQGASRRSGVVTSDRARGLRDLAAMDVSALMEVVASRDQLPVVTTATVVEVETGVDHPTVGRVVPLLLDVAATASSASFETRTAVNAEIADPEPGDELRVTFRLDVPTAVAVIGPSLH